MTACAARWNPTASAGQLRPTPKAGIGIYERGLDGLLAAAGIHDDVEAPVEHARGAGAPHYVTDRATRLHSGCRVLLAGWLIVATGIYECSETGLPTARR